MPEAPVPNQVDMSVIQEAINRRRQGGVSPQVQQQTGAAAPPSSVNDVMTQRAAEPGTATQPAQTQSQPTTTPQGDSPEENKIIVQMLLKRLQKLL